MRFLLYDWFLTALEFGSMISRRSKAAREKFSPCKIHETLIDSIDNIIKPFTQGGSEISALVTTWSINSDTRRLYFFVARSISCGSMINPIIERRCVKARHGTRCDLRNRIFIIQITILRQGDSPSIRFVRSPWDSSSNERVNNGSCGRCRYTCKYTSGGPVTLVNIPRDLINDCFPETRRNFCFFHTLYGE